MRSLRLILVCMLLGAVTTVGVAWGLALGGRRPHGPRQLDVRHPSVEFHVYNLDTTPGVLYAYGGQRRGDLRSEPHEFVPRWFPAPFRERIFIQATGWPCLAVLGAMDERDDASGRATFHPRREALILKPDAPGHGPPRLVPLRPLPLGFTIDTAFYGTIWFALIVSPGILRRKIRKRRGLCPSCGYDMRESDGVRSECGT